MEVRWEDNESEKGQGERRKREFYANQSKVNLERDSAAGIIVVDKDVLGELWESDAIEAACLSWKASLSTLSITRGQ